MQPNRKVKSVRAKAKQISIDGTSILNLFLLEESASVSGLVNDRIYYSKNRWNKPRCIQVLSRILSCFVPSSHFPRVFCFTSKLINKIKLKASVHLEYRHTGFKILHAKPLADKINVFLMN